MQPGNHAHSGSAGSAGFNGQTGGYTPPPSQAATYVPAQAQTSRASQDRYSNRFGSWRYGRYPFRFYPAGYYVYYGGYYGPGDYFGYYPGDQAFGYTNPDLYPGLIAPRNPLPVTTITLVNPDSNRVAISYTLNGESFVLPAGNQQDVNQACTIVLDRGNGDGAVRYKLTAGVFMFVSVDGGWDLERVPADDNAP